MDSEQWRAVRECFEAVVGLPTAEVGPRLAQLPAEVVVQVQALLDAHRAPLGPLDEPIWHIPGCSEEESNSSPAAGERVGAYRLCESIGRGGMSRVFRAERADGEFQKVVAVKLLQMGFDDAPRGARFRAEREILARLEHPNIARLLDGGITDRGVPFLVMELVHGETVTAFCDRQGNSVAERIATFVQICRAVQYAHQNLVVHRDLKPSNILMNEQGQVKLLDFGIAKILEPHGSLGAGDVTQTGTVMMTPAFASPEQVRGEPVTTATDVYALGLLLYELLTGERAQQVDDLSSAALAERICQVSPERASARVLTGDGATRARRRACDSPERLSRLLRGDLDTIISIAIHKDPRRRYASVAELALDLERHVSSLPVLARRDTLGYVAAKFVRRNRALVSVSMMAVAALIGALALALLGQIRARRAEVEARTDAATAQRVSDFLVEIFEISDPGESRGNAVTARELLDRGAARAEEQLAAEPAVLTKLLRVIARAYGELGLFDREIEALERELTAQTAQYGPESHEVAATLTIQAAAHIKLGSYAKARDLARRALTLQEEALGLEHGDVGDTLSQLGIANWALGDLGEATRNLERSLTIKEKQLGADHVDLVGTLNNLAILRWQVGNGDAAALLYERALTIAERELGGDHPSVAHTLNNLALVHHQAGRLGQARSLHERALAIRRKLLPADHPDIAESLNNLGHVLLDSGELVPAREALSAALAIREQTLGTEHPHVATTLYNLGLVSIALESERARSLLERSLELFSRAFGEVNYQLGYPLSGLAELDRREGDFVAAEQRYSRSLELLERGLGPTHPDSIKTRSDFADLLRQLGRVSEADQLQWRSEQAQEATPADDPPSIPSDQR